MTKTIKELIQQIERLERSGLSLREIARKAELSPGHVCDLKKGRRNKVHVETHAKLMSVEVSA